MLHESNNYLKMDFDQIRKLQQENSAVNQLRSQIIFMEQEQRTYLIAIWKNGFIMVYSMNKKQLLCHYQYDRNIGLD